MTRSAVLRLLDHRLKRCRERTTDNVSPCPLHRRKELNAGMQSSHISAPDGKVPIQDMPFALAPPQRQASLPVTVQCLACDSELSEPDAVHHRVPCNHFEHITDKFLSESQSTRDVFDGSTIGHAYEPEDFGVARTPPRTDIRLTSEVRVVYPCDDVGMPWVSLQDPFAKDPPILLSQGNAFFLSLPIVVGQ